LEDRPSQHAYPQPASRQPPGPPPGVAAGEHIEERASVLDRPGQRTGVVQRPPQRHRAVERDGAEGGLEADAAAERCWDPDRPACVRPEGAGAEAGHYRNSGTAARAARAAPWVAGIAGNAPPGVGGGDAVSELVKIGLAEDNRA